MRIRLPNNWVPRPYQRAAWDYLERGGRHAEIVWHRRAGKDELCLHRTAVAAFERIAGYWHMLPEYESLRACPPFTRWKLPPCEDISFLVTAHRDREGHYTRYIGTDNHFLCVSGCRIGHFHSLAVVMAHEMIHLLQALKKTETRGEHNADFRRKAGLVCGTLGFDPKTFC